MEYNEKILHDVIRQVFISRRHQQGLTQVELSLISKTTRQFVSQVESGKRVPSVSSLGSFTAAVDMSLSELFAEIDRLYLLRLHDLGIAPSSAAEPKEGADAYREKARKPNKQ